MEAVARDKLIKKIERLQREVARLKDEIHKDPLTGAYNRRGVEKERRKMKGSVAILLLDIDNFKSINDAHGHAAGDKVLRKMVGSLTEYVRDGDVVGRWGGEEFVIAFRNAAADDVMRKFYEPSGDTKTSRIKPQEIELDGKKIKITLSGGVANLGEKEKIEDAVARADKALYRVKNTGKNRIEVGA